MNVVEDARIERKIQTRYPGLKKVFYNAYGKLQGQDFFKINNTKVADMLFIDRLNLKAKLGTQIDIEFNEVEQDFYDRSMLTQTWDEVIALTDEIYEYCQQELEEKQQTMPQTVEQYMEGEGEQQAQQNSDASDTSSDIDYQGGENRDQRETSEDGDDENENSSTASDTKAEDETDETADGDASTPKAPTTEEYENKASDEKGIEPGAKALTDIASQSSQKKLVETNDRKITQYLDIPKMINLKEYIIDSETVNKELSEYWSDMSDRDATLSRSAKEFKTKNQKVINYLAKEFEMKKAADKYAKASESKTGVLNTNKLFSYKYNDDIFKKNTVIPNGKDHGMMFFLDWSGSMADNMKGTMEQLLCLALFCKKCNIPFSAYAFSSEYEKRTMNNRGQRQSKNLNEIDLGEVALIELFHDKMNTRQFNRAVEITLAISVMFDRTSRGDFAYWGLPRSYYIGGTPLDHAIILAMRLVPEFQKRTGVQIMNTVFLTDGGSHRVDGVIDRDGRSNRDGFVSDNIIIRDKVSNKQVKVSRDQSGHNRTLECTKPFYQMFKAITGSNTCGFFIAGNREFRYAYDKFVVDANTPFDFWQADEVKKKWNREKSVIGYQSGLDELYILKGGKHLETTDEGLQVDAGASKGALTTAFKKMTKGKLQNRVILSKFIEKIAA